LIDQCAHEGRVESAMVVPGTQLPAFAAMVPQAQVLVVWVIAASYEQLVIRYVFDVVRDLRFGG